MTEIGDIKKVCGKCDDFKPLDENLTCYCNIGICWNGKSSHFGHIIGARHPSCKPEKHSDIEEKDDHKCDKQLICFFCNKDICIVCARSVDFQRSDVYACKRCEKEFYNVEHNFWQTKQQK